jgi:hypothetical protein
MSAGTRTALGLSLALAACTPARSPGGPTVSLRMSGSPADATVIVDEESLGSLDFVAAHGVALPPGTHYVTVKSPGYFPLDRAVEAKAGDPPIQLDVALTRVPD